MYDYLKIDSILLLTASFQNDDLKEDIAALKIWGSFLRWNATKFSPGEVDVPWYLLCLGSSSFDVLSLILPEIV